jgi:hypothetical protein
MIVMFSDPDSRSLFTNAIIEKHPNLVMHMSRTSPFITINEENMEVGVRKNIDELVAVYSGSVYPDVQLTPCETSVIDNV